MFSVIKNRIRSNKWLVGASITHMMIDGFSVMMYPILPLIAMDFNLSLSKIGVLRTSYSFSSSVLQFPLSLIFEGFNEIWILLLGLIWISIGFVAMGFSRSFLILLVLSIITGIGGNLQHPVGSAFISRLYPEKKRGSAIGVLNFSGDFGKLIFPLLVTGILIWFNWHWCLTILGVLGIVTFLILELILLASGIGKIKSNEKSRKGKLIFALENHGAFVSLSFIGVIDGITRSALLTYIPFLFVDKGISPENVGLLLTILLIGGATGRLGCGFLVDKFGSILMIVITEFFTAISIFTLLIIHPLLLIPLLIFCGFMVNGTSTVIYTTIASTIKSETRESGYGLFFTIYLIAEAVGPLLFGLIGDAIGLSMVFITLSLISTLIIPIALYSKRFL